MKFQHANREKHPHILYWFWTDETIQEQRYLQQLDEIKEYSNFDLVFITAREQMNFYDVKKMHPHFKTAVEHAHALGIQFGLQIWVPGDGASIPEGGLLCPPKQSHACLEEGEVLLDENGRGVIMITGNSARSIDPIDATLHKAYIFRKKTDGLYFPGTLCQLPAGCIRLEKQSDKCVLLHIDAGSSYAGFTAYGTAAFWYHHGDMYSGIFEQYYGQLMEQYADIPFDGMALDEFGYLHIRHKNEQLVYRGRHYGESLKREFELETGLDLDQVLLDMRYVAVGEDSRRMRAINQYFEFIRKGPMRVERFFAQKARECFGQDVFLGVHNTFHNGLNDDEIWATGINWWDLPRKYGQTDEAIAFPVRLGIACAAQSSIYYDMYYDPRSAGRFYEKAIDDARYNCRIHYHALGDTQTFGMDVGQPEVLRNIHIIEQKLSLLNDFDAPLPKGDPLVLFGFPAVANWYPDISARGQFDINEKNRLLPECRELWDNGYIAAAVPDYAIGDGRLTITDDGQLDFCGHRFSHLIFLYPQYSKPDTIALVNRYIAMGGKPLICGELTHDFDGNSVSDQLLHNWQPFMQRQFEIALVHQMGIRRNPVPGGCEMEDGSVIVTDLEAALTDVEKPFRVCVDDKVIEGKFTGVFAAKVEQGNLLKLACSGTKRIVVDGKPLIAFAQQRDIYIEQQAGELVCFVRNVPEEMSLDAL